MGLLDKLVEVRIEAAQARGEFDNLPGAGRPVPLGDDALVPEELRAAYRLLKNAGYLPAAMQLRAEVASVEQLLRTAVAEDERNSLRNRQRRLWLQLELSGMGDLLRREPACRDKLLQHGGQVQEANFTIPQRRK